MTANATDVTFAAKRRQLAGMRALVGRFMSLSQAMQAHVAGISDAHARRAQFSSLPHEAVSDVAIPAEDILSAGSYSEALPFFMQSGFGRRD